jgi:ABC-2 type transport system ATP-binding protein
MAIIEIDSLAKSYRIYQKQEGLLASVRGLFHRAYREVEAVRGIDLRLEAGEFVAFLGPNGAGKTTTLKLLSGVINPTSGPRSCFWTSRPSAWTSSRSTTSSRFCITIKSSAT